MKTTLVLVATILFSHTMLAQYSDPGDKAREVSNMDDYIQVNLHEKVRSRSINPEMLTEYLEGWMTEANCPGMSVSLLHNGQMYWLKHFGLANIEGNRPVTDSTTFLQCSISKTIEITAIMQLWEQGYFNLDDDVNDYLSFSVRNPDYPDNIITIRNLMTHMSSIKDNWSMLQTVDVYGEDSPIELEEFLMGYLVPEGTYWSQLNYYEYPPEDAYNYTNIGAALLGYLVEIFSGQSFEEYCKEHIFAPLGMYETSFFLANISEELLATMYYQGGSQLVPWGTLGIPYYPAATLKTSAINLSKFLGMYLLDGTYNGVQILEKATIDTIKRLQDVPRSMGLIWFYNSSHNFYNHSGGWTLGANSYYGFDDETQTGFTWMGNTYNFNDNLRAERNEYLRWFSDFYEELKITSFSYSESDNDKLIEPGEEVSLEFSIKNYSNLSDAIDDMTITISCESPYVTFTSDTIISLNELAYLGTTTNHGNPFVFSVAQDLIPGDLCFNLRANWGTQYESNLQFRLSAGHADIVLVHDESDERSKDMNNAEIYREVLDSLRQVMTMNYHYYNVEWMGDPDYEFLSNFPVVIWFTGYDSLNTLTVDNQQQLSQFLDNGGNLFLTGQNISQEISSTSFLEDYLHAEHINDSYEGTKITRGIAGDPVGDDFLFILYNSGASGTGADNLESPDEINPVNGGEMCFEYLAGEYASGVRYESDYKTVFLSYGFEAISVFEWRYELMQRILEYFNLYVGEENDVQVNDNSLSVYPNPVQNNTTIKYSLTARSKVEIFIYDVFGREFKTLVSEVADAGEHEINWYCSDRNSGIYFIRLETQETTITQKVLLY